MKPYRVGLDVDGVLADFISAWVRHIATFTGKNVTIPPGGPLTWHWDRDAGITKAEEKTLWERVDRDPVFWESLRPLPKTTYALDKLSVFARRGALELYFITNRRGLNVKRQTESWLARWGADYPTVLLAHDPGHKAEFAVDLELSAFIDDKPENLQAVKEARGRKVTTYTADAPYNAEFKADKRVAHVGAFADAIASIVVEQSANR